MEPPAGQDQSTQPERRACVACPRCGQGYRVSVRLLGRRLICRHCREEWRAAEVRPEDFRSGVLLGGGDNGDSASIDLPDDLPAAGSSGASSVAIDTRWAGRTLGRYRVSSLLGHGGMAVVWRAHDDALRRDVALKILNQRKEREGYGRLNTELFMQEARAIARLQHPSVVSIYEVAEDQEQVFLALELMEGGTLKEYVDRFGRIPPRELWSMMVQPAKALALAHRREIIHRDIKPSNLMFDEHGHLKLMDFGLADVAFEDASQLIRGKAVGSFGWIAPETARGQDTTAASDIYSLGLVMLYALRGRPWIAAHSRAEFLELHRNPPALDLGGIKGLTPRGMELLKTCLAVEPTDRYLSASLLADALQECADERTAEASRRRKGHVGVAVIAAIIGGLAVSIAALQYFTYLMDQDGMLQVTRGRPSAGVSSPTPAAAPAPAAAPPSIMAPATPPNMAPLPPTLTAPPEAATAEPQSKRPDASEDNVHRPWPEVYGDTAFHFVASKNGKVFHRADSPCGRRIFASNLVTFSTVEEALAAGRTPCPECHPEEKPAGPALEVSSGPSED